MTLVDTFRPPGRMRLAAVLAWGFRSQRATFFTSSPVKFLKLDISSPYAERGPPAGPPRGRVRWLGISGGAGPLLHPVGRLAADRDARGGSGDRAAGAPPAGRHADRCGADPRRARGGHPRAPGPGRGGARGDRRPARREAAPGLVPDRRSDARAARDRRLPGL